MTADESGGQKSVRLTKQFIKFCIVGATAFLIDFGLLILFVEVFHIDILIASSISFVAAMIFNYLASMRFVFVRKDNANRWLEFFLFALFSLIGLGINALMMWSGVAVLQLDYRVIKIIATAVVMVWNFVTRKLFLEKRGA